MAKKQEQVDPRVLFESEPKKAFDMVMEATQKAQEEAKETRLLCQMKIGSEGLEADNSAQLWWLAGNYSRGGVAPKDDMFDKDRRRSESEVRSRLFIKMAFGAELGIKPLQALQNIAIINNRPSIWGDAAKALVLRSGLAEYIYEKEIGTRGKDDWGYECRTKRKGQEEEKTTFTWAEAKMAGLIDKHGSLYKLYPARMMMFRARGFRLRDTFPDVLKGLVTVEEARDQAEDRVSGDSRPSVDDLLADDPAGETETGNGDGDGNTAPSLPTPDEQAAHAEPEKPVAAGDIANRMAWYAEQVALCEGEQLTTLGQQAKADHADALLDDAALIAINGQIGQKIGGPKRAKPTQRSMV